MVRRTTVTDLRTVLSITAGVLPVLGVVAFLFDEFLFAGLCFLVLTMVLYVRETRT